MVKKYQEYTGDYDVGNYFYEGEGRGRRCYKIIMAKKMVKCSEDPDLNEYLIEEKRQKSVKKRQALKEKKEAVRRDILQRELRQMKGEKVEEPRGDLTLDLKDIKKRQKDKKLTKVEKRKMDKG